MEAESLGMRMFGFGCAIQAFDGLDSDMEPPKSQLPKGFKQYIGKQILSSMVCESVTRSEIINIVHAFKDGKSPGPDNIGPKLLKSILIDLTDPLVYICNLSFTTCLLYTSPSPRD